MSVVTPPEEFVTILTHLHVRPERIGDFMEAVDRILPLSAREEGMVRFQYMQHADDPGHFTFVDIFRSQAAFDQHMEEPHLQVFAGLVPDLLSRPPESAFYRTLRSHQQESVAI